MRKLKFKCVRGHDCGEIEDTGDEASRVAVGQTRLRFVGGCDDYSPKGSTNPDRCGAKVGESSAPWTPPAA
jgi:hypothetical protein